VSETSDDRLRLLELILRHHPRFDDDVSSTEESVKRQAESAYPAAGDPTQQDEQVDVAVGPGIATGSGPEQTTRLS
jgi:hypothetical protein